MLIDALCLLNSDENIYFILHFKICMILMKLEKTVLKNETK